MRHIKNFFYKFMAGYHQEMRDLFNRDVGFIYNPIKSSFHDMRMQKWMNRVRD